MPETTKTPATLTTGRRQRIRISRHRPGDVSYREGSEWEGREYGEVGARTREGEEVVPRGRWEEAVEVLEEGGGHSGYCGCCVTKTTTREPFFLYPGFGRRGLMVT
jgi:hypothetical protein